VRYQSLEKAALAMVFSARRLRHYFQSFMVVVMTDLPIQKVLQKPDVAGRMVRWVVELSEFDIQYEPRGYIKGQVYADFLKGAFVAFELVHVPREQNARADLLTKLASSGKGGRQRTVIQETLKTPRTFVADNRVDILQISAFKKEGRGVIGP